MPEQMAQWIEIDAKAYRHNLRAFRRILGAGVKLMAVVKANGYGHGAAEIAALAVAEGVDYLGLHALAELEVIRPLAGDTPICLLGPSYPWEAEAIAAARVEPTVASLAVARELARAGEASGHTIPVHVKVETGTHRQGIDPAEIPAWAAFLAQTRGIRFQGLHTHFANIEDTTDHTFAHRQIARLREAREAFAALGMQPQLLHSACSAAAIVMTETHGDLVRLGIASYGLWPSRETYLSTLLSQRRGPELLPVLSWKTRIAQIKEVAAGSYVGYGCTFRATHAMRLAVLPTGYSDGYDRRLSDRGHVLVRGRRAPVIGRICMNMTMVDITDHAEVGAGEVVTLIGREDTEEISADALAALCGTINYEIVARLGGHIPRVVVGM